MNPSIVIPPYGEVAYVDEVKNHVKGEADITDDDALINLQIGAARRIIEGKSAQSGFSTETVMLATTFDLVLDCFEGTCIEISRVPLISVTSITYVDTAGITQTLATSVYTVDTYNGKIHLAYAQFWPSTRSIPNAVTVRFVAGLAVVVTAVAATDVLTAYGRSFANGDVVQLANSGGALPTGLLPKTPYYVVNASGSTFKLSLTLGGVAIDITQAGTGIHYAGTAIDNFTAGRQAALIKVTRYYRSRGDQGMELGSAVDRDEVAIDALVSSMVA